MFIEVHQAFNANGYGWAENYVLSRSDAEDIDFTAGSVWPLVLGPRMALMNKDVEIGPARLSKIQFVEVPAGSGGGMVVNTGIVRPAQYLTATYPASTRTGCLPNVAAKGLLYILKEGRNRSISLRGLWSGLDAGSGAFANTSGIFDAYKAAFATFVKALSDQGGGWFGSTKHLRVGNIVSVTPIVAGAGRQTITFDGVYFDPTEVGKHVKIRISSAKRNPSLNGSVIVVPRSDKMTCDTVNALLSDTYAGGAKATITPLSFLPIFSGALIRVGHHDTGNPTIGSRGRSKAKPKA